MSDDQFRSEQKDEEKKFKEVQEALQTLPATIANIMEKQNRLADRKYQKLEDDVRSHWDTWMKGLLASLKSDLDVEVPSDEVSVVV